MSEKTYRGAVIGLGIMGDVVDGMRAFEMIAAIDLSHRAGKRPIEFPLVERDFEIPSN